VPGKDDSGLQLCEPAPAQGDEVIGSIQRPRGASETSRFGNVRFGKRTKLLSGAVLAPAWRYNSTAGTTVPGNLKVSRVPSVETTSCKADGPAQFGKAGAGSGNGPGLWSASPWWYIALKR